MHMRVKSLLKWEIVDSEYHTGDGPGNDRRIVASLSSQYAFRFAIIRGSGLFLAYSGSRFEGNSEVDQSAVRDATLDTARVIRLGG
jgi:hypothetical protein